MHLHKIPLYFLIAQLGYATILTDNKELNQILQIQNNKFTGKMLSTVINDVKRNTSVVLSPFAVLIPLTLLTFASEGSTHVELLNATGLRSDYETMYIFSQVVNHMKSHSDEFKMANKLYVNENYELNDNFDAISHDVFKGEVDIINFSRNKKSAAEINQWVSDETNNHFKNLINPSILSADTKVLLVNVLYFKGKWKMPFSKLKTKEETFYEKEHKIRIPMMHITQNYNYLVSNKLDAKVIEIPYVGNETSLVIVLPNEMDGLKNLIVKLKDLNSLYEEMKKFTKITIDVAIPKFVVKTTVNLKNVLQKMNIRKIFNNKANLNKLLKGPQDLYVSEAIQKAFIEVNEDGAEVAGANDVEVLSTRRMSHPSFVANHPFAFFLKKNDIVLLSGMYMGH